MTSPATRHREGVWEREQLERGSVRCLWADCTEWAEECEGELQAIHLIPRQTLRMQRENMTVAPHRYPADDPRHNLVRVSLDDLYRDPRNGCPACEVGHHAPFDKRDGKSLALPYMPDHLLEFAREYGLEHRLPPVHDALLTRDHREEAA